MIRLPVDEDAQSGKDGETRGDAVLCGHGGLPALLGNQIVPRIDSLAASRTIPQPTSLAYSSQRPTSLRLEFAVNFEAARETSAAIRGFLSGQGVPDGELFSYELCVAEACYNAIEYAKDPSGGSRPIADVIFTPEEIVVRVTDQTEGFTMPEKIPAPSPMSDRGRGLFIIQSIMDDVEYIRGRGENVLVMRKRRNAIVALQAAR